MIEVSINSIVIFSFLGLLACGTMFQIISFLLLRILMNLPAIWSSSVSLVPVLLLFSVLNNVFSVYFPLTTSGFIGWNKQFSFPLPASNYPRFFPLYSLSFHFLRLFAFLYPLFCKYLFNLLRLLFFNMTWTQNVRVVHVSVAHQFYRR